MKAKAQLIKIPIAPKDVNDIAAAFERAVTPKTKLILVSHQINLTGQINPVKKVCEMARARGIETIVDGAHSFAQFDFKRDDLGCDYFGTSLHKWIYAPKGTGMLYVRKEKIPKVWALMASRRSEQERHPQVRRDRYAFGGNAARDRRSDPISQRHRRQTKRGTAAISFAILDEQSERRSEGRIQHVVRSRAVVRDREF